MNKFPQLEMMRAQRRRREAEITAPYRAELSTAAAMISSLRARLREIERLVGTEIGKHIFARVGEQISEKIMRLIYEAVAKATRKPPGEPIQIWVPADVLRFSDPRSLESEVLRRYARETAPALSLRVDANPSDCVTYVDIRVPELGCRQIIAQ